MTRSVSGPAMFSLIAGILALGLFSPPPARSAPADRCDRFASPHGSDSAPGTLRRPFGSAERLEEALRPGQTGCFRGGGYSFGVLRVETPRVTLTSFRDARVTLKGDITVARSGARSAIVGMRLNGAGGTHEIGPRIYADGVVLRGNNITNHHVGTCVHVTSADFSPAPRGVRVQSNKIHDCGLLPATNHEHGIYLGDSRDTIVRDNWIYGNADRGVQLYPDSDGARITGNVIDGNGQGLSFGGGPGGSSDGNVAIGNVITNSAIRFNVESIWQGPIGTGNVARDNCVWTTRESHLGSPKGSGIRDRLGGFTAFQNRIAKPRFFSSRSHDYRLRRASGCRRKYTGGGRPY